MVAREQVAEVVGDVRRSIGELVEEVEQAGADVVVGQPAARRTVAGQQIEVIALVIGQPERAGQRGEDLW